MTTATLNPYEAPLAECDPSLVAADLAVGEEGWTVRFELTPEDLVTFSMYTTANSKATRQSVRGLGIAGTFAVLVPLFWCTALVHMTRLEGTGRMLLGMAVTSSLLVSWLGFVFTYLWTAGRHKQNFYSRPENANAIGSRTVRLFPDYVKLASPTSESTTSWRGITRIERHPAALYLHTSEHAAIIVPKRAFSEDALYEQFAKVAAEFHAHARRAE